MQAFRERIKPAGMNAVREWVETGSAAGADAISANSRVNLSVDLCVRAAR